MPAKNTYAQRKRPAARRTGTVGAIAGCAFAVTLGAAASLITFEESRAAGFYVRENSTSAMGTAFAGAASRGLDASHLFYNPATIVENEPASFTLDGRYFDTDVRINPSNAISPVAAPLNNGIGSGNMADPAVAPSLFGSYALSETVSLGIGVAAPFAVVIDTENGWDGRFHLTETDMRTINVNPVVAWQITPVIAIGVGLQVQYFKADLRNGQILPIAVPPFFTETEGYLKGSDTGVGFTAGILLKPAKGTSIGVGYRSRIKHTLKGKAGVKLAGVPVQKVKFDITTPDVLNIAFSQDINPQWAVHGQVEWVNWSLFKDITVKFDSGLADQVRPQGWKDTWSGFLGVTFKASEKTMLSAGAGYTSAVSSGTGSSIIADSERTTVALGATHKPADWITLAASYAHVFFKDNKLDIASPTAGVLQAKTRGDIDILGLSATLIW